MTAVTLELLAPLARELAEESLTWMEPFAGTEIPLLTYPGHHGFYSAHDVGATRIHLVRESVWWATGLLLRNRGDDAARAHRVLENVLTWQFNEPGMPYHGTWHRAPEEKLPPGAAAAMWGDYDPNWRQFIGCSFIIILEKLADRLSPELKQKLEASIQLAVEGETPERIHAGYSNIAMMQAVLLVYAGKRFDQPEWTKRGRALAGEIYGLFAEHETFSEYNSPTYYGIILYALRLWRLMSHDPQLEAWGEKMESGLWRHIAAYYHPRLRNLCGPFDRSYGMDMTRYAAGIGLWMRLELGREIAPAPLVSAEFDHPHDYVLSPVIALLGTDIPGDLLSQLRASPQERSFRQIIESTPTVRTATACLKPDRMWGAESGSRACGGTQFHAATVHWLQPDGKLAWMRLQNAMFVDATASPQGLRITATNGANPARLMWKIYAGEPPVVTAEYWVLPGMRVRVKSTLPVPQVDVGEDGLYFLSYEMEAESQATLELEFSS